MPRKIVWIEVATADGARGQAFWGSFLDSPFKEFADSGYHMFEGEPSGGIYENPEQAGKGPLVYFGSDDIEADIAKTQGLGGTAGEKQPIPGMGWFAHCSDTEGNAFGLFQGDESAPTPGE